MDKEISAWVQKRKEEINAIRKGLLPLILQGFLSSLKPWLVIFVVALIATVLAIFFTYLQEGGFVLADFFPPNFGWGLLGVLGVLFVYQTAAAISLELKDLRIRADKFTWNDIEISLYPFPLEHVFAYGLKIKNNKPFKLEKALVKITYLEADKESCYGHIYPKNLAWVSERQYLWEGIDVDPDGGEQIAALFNTHEWEGRLVFFIPGPDGQPSERKSMGDLGDEERILIADFELGCSIDGCLLPAKTITIRAEVVNNKLKAERYEIPK